MSISKSTMLEQTKRKVVLCVKCKVPLECSKCDDYLSSEDVFELDEVTDFMCAKCLENSEYFILCNYCQTCLDNEMEE